MAALTPRGIFKGDLFVGDPPLPSSVSLPCPKRHCGVDCFPVCSPAELSLPLLGGPLAVCMLGMTLRSCCRFPVPLAVVGPRVLLLYWWCICSYFVICCSSPVWGLIVPEPVAFIK